MFYVADGDSTLLSHETAIYLKILNKVNSVKEIRDIRNNNLKETSHGTGTYKGRVVKLHIDKSVKPTAQLHSGIPFHMRTKVKNIQYKFGRLHVAPFDRCATPKSRKPYNMSPLPDGPSMEVSVDFKVLPNSEYLLVITDDYSRYPIVEIITSTAAKVVIPVIN